MDDGVKGDWPKLERVRVRLEGLGRGESRVRLVRAVGETALTELRKGFERGAAPDGAGWKRTTDGKRPLAGFERYWSLRYAGSVAQLASDHPGARAHHRGAVILPKRGGVGRDTRGKFTRGKMGVLAFTVGERKVFARKVKLPSRRMTPRSGTLEGWVQPIADAVDREFTAIWEGR